MLMLIMRVLLERQNPEAPVGPWLPGWCVDQMRVEDAAVGRDLRETQKENDRAS